MDVHEQATDAVAPQRPHSDDWKNFDEAAAARRPSASSLRTPYSSAWRGRRPSPADVQTAITAGFVAHHTTEPGTPISGTDEGDFANGGQSLFHNYLRALHPFDPATSSLSAEDVSLSTVAIRAGDLILVHCIHANGWADGTVLNTGVRGWLPTNYCEAYDHPHLRNLLNAMTQFWDLLGASEDQSLSTFVRQDYIRGLIAGVRYLLERADCLHRDVPTVKQYAGVRRMRKGLLADLSSLVQIAKRLQETISETFAPEVIHVLLDDLISKAFRVVTRAVSFIDVWAQETGNDCQRWSFQRPDETSPPANATLAVDTSAAAQKGVTTPIDSAVHFPDRSAHDDTIAGAGQEPDSGGDKAPRLSMVFTPPDGVVAHRLSLVTKDQSHVGSGVLASDQLAKVHDVCISHIGAFIGHHLHARPASELVATTERLVTACRKMLAIVDEVCAHDTQISLPLHKVKEDFEVKVEELSRSTKDVFRFSDSPDDEVIMMPDQTEHLISVGTSLIRNTGECVVKTRQLIEQIGDFELKSSGTLTARTSVEIPVRSDSMPPNEPPTESIARESRQSADMRLMPPPPPPVPVGHSAVEEQEQDLETHTASADSQAQSSTLVDHPKKVLPLSSRRRSGTRASETSSHHGLESLKSPRSLRSDSISPARKDSFGTSITGSTETFSSMRDSSTTAVSQASTRATTPDYPKPCASPDAALMSSFASISSMRSLVTEDSMDAEAQLLQKSYAHELTWNKEGQVTGGSLPALVEQLTTHDVAPDPQFVSAFFLTFRKFSEPREFAQVLIHRFDYIGDSKTTGTPVRLRIYNVFKGWLETYWNAEADKEALGEIRFFALHKLKQVLPSAGDRLVELTRRITEGYANGTASGPLVSGVGKSSMSIGTQSEKDIPDPMVTAKQLNALRVATGGGAQCSIMDFEPMELARQITLLMMKSYCDIRPDELLSMDWGKCNTKKAKNIRRMCLLNTDLANLVGETILAPDEAKKRAGVIKQWAKIGLACLELNNYDSVMSIMCSINSSVVQRLKRTWDVVNKKTRARLEELDKVVDMSKNYTTLRRRLETPTAPCLPFLGVYLTDLTFVIAGNPKRRQLPGSMTESGEEVSVINFDMYTRIAKIISHLQRFQVPYRLKLVPEMQTWVESHLKRMRDRHDDLLTSLHRRSMAVEPKDVDRKAVGLLSEGRDERPRTVTGQHGHSLDRFDFFLKNASFAMKTSSASPTSLQIPDTTDPMKRASAQ